MLMNVEQVAERLGISERTVRRWSASGVLPPSIKVGRCARWSRESIRRWIAHQEKRARALQSARCAGGVPSGARRRLDAIVVPKVRWPLLINAGPGHAPDRLGKRILGQIFPNLRISFGGGVIGLTSPGRPFRLGGASSGRVRRGPDFQHPPQEFAPQRKSVNKENSTMHKMPVFIMCLLAIVLGTASTAHAEVIIGTATYNGTAYNLIRDDDNNGNSLVWLDYSNPEAYWADQMAWAAELDGYLTYNIDPSYTVTWSDSSWRLPSAGSAPAYGFQAATQEMGHLYYDDDELGFTGGSSSDGVVAPDLAGSIFENLALTGYWTSTQSDPLFSTAPVWMFAFKGTRSAPYYDTVYGFQDIDATAGGFSLFGTWISLAVKHSGLAVRGGEVSVSSPIPEPASSVALASLFLTVGAIWLVQRRKK